MKEGHSIRKLLQVQYDVRVAQAIEKLKWDGEMGATQKLTLEQLEKRYEGKLHITEVKQLKALLDAWMYCDLDIYSIKQEG